jgi:hypothetical protein
VVKIEALSGCCKELSACCAAVVPRLFFSCWYTSPTPSVEGVGNMSKSGELPLHMINHRGLACFKHLFTSVQVG